MVRFGVELAASSLGYPVSCILPELSGAVTLSKGEMLDVQIGQFLGHGSGGNFSRWLDETQFQQCVGSLGGDDFDVLTVDLFMPGQPGDFGPPKIEVKLRKKDRKIKALLILDPASYGSIRKSDERIRAIVQGLGEVVKHVCIAIGRPEIAEDFCNRVQSLDDSILER